MVWILVAIRLWERLRILCSEFANRVSNNSRMSLMKDEDCVKAIASSLRLFGDKSSILDKGVLKDVEGWESTQQKLMSWAKQHKNMYNICLFFFMKSVLSADAAASYVRHKYPKHRFGQQNAGGAHSSGFSCHFLVFTMLFSCTQISFQFRQRGGLCWLRAAPWACPPHKMPPRQSRWPVRCF